MAPPVEVLIRRPAPDSSDAFSTLIVPSTLMRASFAGSATDLRTSICAARWKTVSGRARPKISAIARGSRMSASTSSAPPCRFSLLPVERSSRTVTSSPRSTRASTRFEPMKPAPPVTRARMSGVMVTMVRAQPAEPAAFGEGRPGPCYGRRPMRGLFVTFEGIDRSGKTTQARMLLDALGDDAVGVREPGGTEVGERVRELLKDTAFELSAEGEALLFAAARAELVAQVIRPALEQRRVVVSDRFLDSSLAYQGAARGLGVKDVAAVNALATGGLEPDLTFLLALDPAEAAGPRGESDRFEDEGRELQERVLAAYEELAASGSARWRRVDAARAPEQVHANVLAEVEAARGGRAEVASSARAPGGGTA